MTHFIILITMAKEVLPTTLHKLLEGVQCLISKQIFDVFPPMLAEIQINESSTIEKIPDTEECKD